ncbi:MAG TPA: response regulator transcription factor [Longilinea sp.]|nr:response regulator transcription factor [Longilinea sp.]
MSRTVLVVDDKQSIRVLLSDFLTGQGYTVITASDGVEACELVKENPVDIILLDIMMPNMDGYQFITRLHKESEIPVIMITAKQEEADLVRAYDLGTDDFLTKPFSMRELLVRMRAVLRRSEHKDSQQVLLTTGCLVVDRSYHTVSVEGEQIELTPIEFEILEILMLANGQIVNRADFSTRLIENGYLGSEATLKIHIRNIRTKIEKDPNDPQYIETVFGVGYRIKKNK